jgi:prevent-host-death family protein
MAKRYSIAEARHNLAAIIHNLERKPTVELTRRGEPVAVLMSFREYHRLTSNSGKFWDAFTKFRKDFDLSKADIEPDVFKDVRDTSPGRETPL